MERQQVTVDFSEGNTLSGSWIGNQVSESARVHQGHVFNISTYDTAQEACLKLLFSDYEGGKDRNAKRAPGTCEWVLGHEKFIRWRDNPYSGALWVSADPGCGKSVLSRALVDEGLVESLVPDSQPSTVCYFFFKDDDAGRKTSQAALRGLLYQIFNARRRLISHVMGRYRKKKESLATSMVELWQTLESVAQDPGAGPIICILDALDECDETSRSDLIQMITNFITSDKRETTQLKFLMTSRPYPEIEWEFRCNIDDLDVINLRGDEDSYRIIHSEINLFIEDQVPKVFRRFRYRPSKLVQSRVIAELQGRDNRTYLWVSLVLDDLIRTRLSQEDEIVEFINHVPRNLDTAYEKLLGRILPQHKSSARALFHIVLGANYPLHVQDVHIALAIANGKVKQGDRLSATPQKEVKEVEEYLKTIAGSFITIVDSRVFLLHQTARDFLIATQWTVGLEHMAQNHEHKWIRSFALKDSHFLLAKICMTFLLLEDFNQDDESHTRNKTFSFNYACQNWIYHCRWSNFGSMHHTDDLLRLAQQVCRFDSTPRSFFIQAVYIRPSERMTMKSASDTTLLDGNFNMIQYLLKQGAASNLESLMYIVSHLAPRGQLETLSVLLSLRVDCEVMAAITLRIAVETDDLDFVKLLLTTSKSAPGVQAALGAACFLGALSMTRYLIDHGAAKPDAQTLGYGICRSEIDLEMISTLIKEYGVDPNEQWNGRTSLATFITGIVRESQDQVAAVQLLLDLGADPNGTCSPGSLLEMAISKGNVKVAEVLIKSGANLNITTVSTRLKWHSDSADISGCYNWEDVDAILEVANTTDPADKIGKRVLLSNILQHCPDDAKIFRHLAKLDTYVNDRDIYNWTPLMEAAHHGKTKVLENLIALGADVNNADKWGRTELMFTAKRDNLEAAIILVSRGADVNQADSDGVTALRYAVGSRSKRVCEYLLSIGAKF